MTRGWFCTWSIEPSAKTAPSRSLGARVTVLHEGAVLAEGSIDHVQNHPRVIEVYLGR